MPTDSLLVELTRSLRVTHPDRAEGIVLELARRLEAKVCKADLPPEGKGEPP